MSLRHWLRIQLKKVLTSLLWKMKKTIKTLIVFFSFLIKILTTTNATCDIPINTLTYPTNYHTWPSLFLSIEVIFHCSKPIFVLFNSLSLIALDLKIMKSTSKNYQFLVPSIFLFLFSLHLELFITSYWCISWTQNLKGTITH